MKFPLGFIKLLTPALHIQFRKTPVSCMIVPPTPERNANMNAKPRRIFINFFAHLGQPGLFPIVCLITNIPINSTWETQYKKNIKLLQPRPISGVSKETRNASQQGADIRIAAERPVKYIDVLVPKYPSNPLALAHLEVLAPRSQMDTGLYLERNTSLALSPRVFGGAVFETMPSRAAGLLQPSRHCI
jgi:hypothetical protein